MAEHSEVIALLLLLEFNNLLCFQLIDCQYCPMRLGGQKLTRCVGCHDKELLRPFLAFRNPTAMRA